MTVVSVSMPDELIERIDAFVAEHGYSGRSEVLREAARDLLDEFVEHALTGRRVMAVVTVLFNHEVSGLEHRMTDLRHTHEELVTSNLHSHVGDGLCMELFILEGDLEQIASFVGKVRATEAALSVDYSIVPVDGATPDISHARDHR